VKLCTIDSRKFRHGTSIVAMRCQLSATKINAQREKQQTGPLSVNRVDCTCDDRRLVYHTDRPPLYTTRCCCTGPSATWCRHMPKHIVVLIPAAAAGLLLWAQPAYAVAHRRSYSQSAWCRQIAAHYRKTRNNTSQETDCYVTISKGNRIVAYRLQP